MKRGHGWRASFRNYGFASKTCLRREGHQLATGRNAGGSAEREVEIPRAVE